LPLAAGCLVAGAGVLVTDALVGPHSGLELFGWSLALVGAGLGVVMVAATSAVLGVVPASRSGMGASIVNTSRELGAVAGVAVLGSIVNGEIIATLLNRLSAIPGLPSSYRSTVVADVTNGTAGTKSSSLPKTGFIADIVKQVLGAADGSFTHALDVVLGIAGVLLLLSAVVAVALMRTGGVAPDGFGGADEG
jgi:hypothetical protein